MTSRSLYFLCILFETGILKDCSYNSSIMISVASIVDMIITSNSNSTSSNDDNNDIIFRECYALADNETKLLLVMSYCFQSSSSSSSSPTEIQVSVLNKAYDTWKRHGYKLCNYIILSFYINFYKDKNDMIKEFPSSSSSSSSSSSPLSSLTELLSSEFLNRNRKQVRNRQQSGIQDITTSTILVTSWNDIRGNNNNKNGNNNNNNNNDNRIFFSSP